MRRATNLFSGSTLLCGAPVGVVGKTSISMAGLPDSAEFVSLALVLGAFLAGGIWIFQRWGSSADEVEAAGDPATQHQH